MRTELKTENNMWEQVVEEADGILKRINMHQGKFEYFSQVHPGMFRLIIRPMKRELVHGQPSSFHHADLFCGELHIARYYYT